MTVATNDEVLKKLEELGFSPTSITGRRHAIPRITNLSDERKAIRVNDTEGRRNQLHYLAEASKTGRPWFQNPKEEKQYSEFVLVSPEMAGELLKHNDNPRRRIMQDRIDRYASDMMSGSWHDNSQSIAIDYMGKMHNGQHRVSAVTQCGRAQRLYFTFNTLVDARLDEDTGASRSATEQIELELHNNLGNKLPAICRSAMRGASDSRKSDRFSASDFSEFARNHGATIEWISRICPTHRSDVIAAFLKSVLWYGPDKMEPFMRRFNDMLFTSTSDPAKLLHQQAKGRGISRLCLYRKTLAAIHHYVSGKTVTKLLERDRDIFEWDPGWKVPANTNKEPKS
jgi:hypothetical protein